MTNKFQTKNIERLINKIEKTPNNDCWNWTAANINGYGVISSKGKNYLAHRFSYMAFHGDIPEGMCVCHTCDNPSCINPSHLWIGTVADNNADKVAKNRQAKGEKHSAIMKQVSAKGESHPHSKLTKEKIFEIRKLYDPKTTSYRKLAKEFNVSHVVVYNIIKKNSWKHI